jgi:nucleotide sugar dehydrogenase
MRFTPGPGVGGHCLPVDPSYLAWRIETELGESFRFVELANQVNSSMPDYVIHRLSALLARHGKSLAGAQILLLGLSFKKGTSDCRESPSIVVAERALAAGAIVRAVDPHVDAVNAPTSLLPLVPLSSAQLEAADIVVVLVDHDEFDPALIARSAPLVLDTKGLLRSERIRGEIL